MPVKDFDQSELTKGLGPTAKGGVCMVLVIEWLAAGGDLDVMRRNLRMVSSGNTANPRQRVSKAVAKRIETLQSQGTPEERLREYGMRRADGDSLGGGNVAAMVDFVTGHVGWYYIALNPPDDVRGEGHAIGAITTAAGQGRLFDPNAGEMSSVNYPGALRFLADDYAGPQYGLTAPIALRVMPPSFRQG
jgi:hypothetical protein